ncbi:MAG: hypothetical protein KPEEDBHJ_00173 [Anaerolineales bacterium]|nr:hypothetical protein [Anaerolineales bacterium]
MNLETSLGIARLIISGGGNRDDAINNPAIPYEYREQIREILEREDNIVLEPARILVSGEQRDEWLRQLDRSDWYYWPTLRTYLLGSKNWSAASVRSLDEATDRILGQMLSPSTEQFDIRGLVVGYVQSGKTANFTSLIAKAADIGYRLIIVLSGIDNGLRRQTQIRLNKELTGYSDNRRNAVPLPPMGRQWHQFTTEDANGDFHPGNANYGALQGTQPVLLVVKKNGSVLRRLHGWLDSAPDDVRRTLPVLVIDDEADQASVDTRGSYQSEGEPLPDDYEEPTVINRLIRDLLRKFQRRAYVAYTATPFANILIPHNIYDPRYENDLYPRDFIVDLPKPDGYFGAEEQFGRFNGDSDETVGGLDIIRNVPETELDELKSNGLLPRSLETAMLDFVLAGAARAYRRDQQEQTDFPATMLLHGSHLVLRQIEMANLVGQRFSELRDEWRYQRNQGILERLRSRWENEFRPVINDGFPSRDATFSQIESFIGPFFEAVQIRVINSRTGEVLDYEREPYLKAIAVGGNRLSRGLTLEGLLTSYFFRSTAMYDTLMQMGRWFGFRGGYEDLTRIFMTNDLASWFSDLALVEYELRQDIRMYETLGVTPMELGTRILSHPAMLVTSRLKSRFSRTIIVEQSYSNQVIQTFRFPFQKPNDLSELLEDNLGATQKLISEIGMPVWQNSFPVWKGISANTIIEFIQNYRIDAEVARNINIQTLLSYIQRQNELGELISWTVVIRGREIEDPTLGSINFGLQNPIPMISRNRLASDPDSLGIITNPGDEEIGLTSEQLEQAAALQQSTGQAANPVSRLVRPATDGLLIIYPVSRFSGYERVPRQSRRRMYEDPNGSNSRDVICYAISFPKSDNAQVIRGEYVLGTVDWRPL